jgi:tyrosinase
METALDDFLSKQNSTLPAGQNLTERIAYLLQSYSQFGPFSHNGVTKASKTHKAHDNFMPVPRDDPTMDANKYGSMEDVHNALHDRVGGGGQMGDPATSAFDPIFWLHHTYVSTV